MEMKEIIKGVLMMAAAVIGMILLATALSFAALAPVIFIVWLIVQHT